MGARVESRKSVLYVASRNSSELCSKELRRDAVWTDNLAQVMRWGLASTRLGLMTTDWRYPSLQRWVAETAASKCQ